MNTTIAVKPRTLEMLRKIKEELKADTLDETITRLIKEKKKTSNSMFGALKDVKEKFVREKIDRFD
ncbi:hypothetical protein HZA98_00865 [Candidatus Woesearchaeota archaeon]|nr:hypothetical protein [Candidatus Woesearchaeota archaeon]